MMLREFSGREDPIKTEPERIDPEMYDLPALIDNRKPQSHHWSDGLDDLKPVGRRALLSSSSGDIEPDTDVPDVIPTENDDSDQLLLPKEESD
jgi:hypothetical protein